jgi:hypothetical protein
MQIPVAGACCVRGHRTEASSPWPQLWFVIWVQEGRRASVPVQTTSSMNIEPLPAP